MIDKLLTRDEFRGAVFKRDNNKCVICKEDAVDAHHIIERRLWDDGGYYLSNGASLCKDCHIGAEQTVISCDQIRLAAGISTVVLPSHLYSDQTYDKWGNITLSHNRRIPGELFHDESVQKILKSGGVFDLFSRYFKYPRTYHLPWSPGTTSDDRVLKNIDIFNNQDIVVTEKMDGENTTMYSDYIHARSIDMDSHPSRDWIKNFWAGIKHEIPVGWRFCGENLFAKHSIKYEKLPSYFMLFSIWDDRNICLSWKDTAEWAKLLNISLVPVLWTGKLSQTFLHSIETSIPFLGTIEGYTIRIADEFHYSKFRYSIAKYVRANHIAGTHNWKYRQIEQNGLAV